MVRQVKVARDTAVRARTQAIVTLKELIVTAPGELRTELEGLSKAALRDRCAGLRPAAIPTPLAAVRHTLRALGRRWQALEDEIKTHDQILDELTAAAAPRMRQAFGIGPDIAAKMLILAGDRPQERIRSEGAFAKLCGAAPIPASSGMTQRYRLNPGGHREANSALYRAVIVRMRFHPATIAYVNRRTAEGKTKREIVRCLKRYLAREIHHYLLQPAARPPSVRDSRSKDTRPT